MGGSYASSVHVPMEDQADHAEQSQQARRRAQHAGLGPVPRRVESQMGANLLECHLDAPTPGVKADDSVRRHRGIGAVKVFVPVRSFDVANEHPADRDQAVAGLVPVSFAPDQFDPPRLAAIPVDGESSALGGTLNGLGRRGPLIRGRPPFFDRLGPDRLGPDRLGPGGSYRLASG